jgi:hypothetical protein
VKLQRIISGGQTGVDRGGLDAALSLGLDHGGTCPAGRRAEDGAIPARYVLVEHASYGYPPRTRQNVHDADATLILTLGKHVTAGTRLTAKLAQEAGKPWLAVNMESPQAVDNLWTWLLEVDPAVLNVAGSRESKYPGIQRTAAAFLRMVIGRLRENNGASPTVHSENPNAYKEGLGVPHPDKAHTRPLRREEETHERRESE